MVEPKVISESHIKQYLGDRVSAMRLFRPIVEGVLREDFRFDKKDSFDVPVLMRDEGGNKVLGYTKFRQMWSEEGGLLHLKYFAANEVATQRYGISRIDVWSLIIEPTTGVTIGFVSGNLTTDIRTALTGVIGFSSLKSIMDFADSDYGVGVLGFGRIGKSVICALESETKKPKEVRIVSLDQNLSELVRSLQEKVSFPLVVVPDLASATSCDAVFDCVAVNKRASLVTRDLIAKTRIYVDISKQAITVDGALSFDLAVFDSLKLARHLPSIAGEAFNLRSNSEPDVPRTFDLGHLMNGHIPSIDGMRPIFTVIGRPAVDAAITQHIFAQLANLSPDQYLSYAIGIAESKKDDF